MILIILVVSVWITGLLFCALYEQLPTIKDLRVGCKRYEFYMLIVIFAPMVLLKRVLDTSLIQGLKGQFGKLKNIKTIQRTKEWLLEELE
jgi:hypothetical protein